MLYIQPNPNIGGSYPSPQSLKAAGLVEFPEEFLEKFLELNGFVKLTIVDNVVTAVRANNTARDAWLAEVAEQEAAEQETAEQETGSNNDLVTWAELDAAYNEGRDAAYEQ